MKTRIAINGFGRIGRYLTRLIAQENELSLVAVNDIMPLTQACHLLAHDSVHGQLPELQVGGSSTAPDAFWVNGSKVTYSNSPAGNWNWRDHDIDIVVEATGLFTERHYGEQHLACGAKQVVVAAPANDADITVVMGVNDHQITDDHRIISNASCTTNCLALPVNVIEKAFGIIHGTMTTVHPFTLRQNLQDGGHTDLRRARACGMNIIPTPVGAHKTLGLVIPQLTGKFHGSSLRVPTATTALIDLTCELKVPATTAEVREALKLAADEHMDYCTTPLVSSDFTGSSFGSVVDEELTEVFDNTMLRLTAWYDNEASFTHQLLRLLRKLAANR